MITLINLKTILARLGYVDYDQTISREFGIFVPAPFVASAIKNISETLVNFEPTIIPPNIINIKIGAQAKKLDLDHIRIRKKNLQRPKAAFGKKNELNFINNINEFIHGNGSTEQQVRPITIVINENGQFRLRYENVASVKDVSKENPFTGNKADVHLMIQNGGYIPISLKDNDATRWEEAATYWGNNAVYFMVYAVTKGETDLRPDIYGGKDVWRLKPQIAIRAEKNEAEKVIFGKDIIVKGGAVLRKTFKQTDFDWDNESETLTINVNNVITKMEDVPERYFPYFEVYNSGSRVVKVIKLPGIRVAASYQHRITSAYKIFGPEVRQWLKG